MYNLYLLERNNYNPCLFNTCNPKPLALLRKLIDGFKFAHNKFMQIDPKHVFNKFLIYLIIVFMVSTSTGGRNRGLKGNK